MGVTEHDLLGPGQEQLPQLVVHGLLHQQALGGHAALPGGELGAVDGGVGGSLEVGVVAHDLGAVAGGLDQRALEPGGAHDAVRGLHGTDEGHGIDPVVADQGPAHVAPAVEHRDGARREAGVEAGLDQGRAP